MSKPQIAQQQPDVSASNIKVSDMREEENMLKLTISGINCSVANSIRRTILADIPTVAFVTTPHEKNKATIIRNTSRLNNEIIKHRLSCIPIHASVDVPLENYLVEINVENNTDRIIYVTTKDFQVKNVVTNTYLSDEDRDKMFPPNPITRDYIDFVRLRPKISELISGEALHMTAQMSVATASENSMFNVASTCVSTNAVDDARVKIELSKKKQAWRDAGRSKEEIEFDAANWLLLDGKRIIKDNAFNFIIESIGVYSNKDLLLMSLQILIRKTTELKDLFLNNAVEIKESINTMKNCYDIVMSEGYTLGKVLEYMVYTLYYNTGNATINYCSFDKYHPHDLTYTFRIAYVEEITPDKIASDFVLALDAIKQLYDELLRKCSKQG